jgi:acyl-CoA dehydrogenase
MSFDERALREDVRRFLDGVDFTPSCDTWLASGYDPAFSERLAAAGFVGMTIPVEYGGRGRSAVERFVVVEELLAAGAPVAAHWMADRQTAPLLLRYGSEAQRRRFLPEIAAGRCYFSIGMSEPASGSDLASISTRADRVEGGWRVNGQKVWTTNAHRSHQMVALVRTSPRGDDRHAGLSQVIVDLGADGVDVRPIELLSGEVDFTEVFLTDVFVPDADVIGAVGDGWHQVVSELSFERSGPERLLSTYPLLRELVRELGADSSAAATIGRRVAHLMALRRMSRAVAERMDAGEPAAVAAALVKDVGTRQELAIIDAARLCVDDPDPEEPFGRLLAGSVLNAPSFTLRGGTNEILRGVIARDLLAA